MTGNIDYIILPLGNIIDYGYDTYNRLQTIEQKANSVTSPALAKIKYTYDANGNRTKEETFDENNILQKYEDYNYNNPADPNRLYRIINPDNTYTEFSYDGNGNKRFAENKKPDSTTTHKTEYIYDALDRLTSVKQTKDLVGGATADTTYGYDLQDNLTSVLDGKGNQTGLEYDDMGRLIKSTSPDTGITRYTYDEAGNLKQKKDAKGNTVTYTCDSLNRLTFIDYPTDADPVYTYDEPASANGKGRLTSVTRAAVTSRYHYDSQGRVSKEEKTILGKAYTTEYDYDQNGNLKGIWYPSGRYTAYRYDRADRVESVTSRHFSVTSDLAPNIQYKPYGGMKNWTLGNGLSPSITYDNQYRISGITIGSLFSRSYTPDDVGNILALDDQTAANKDQGFTYDPLNRLNNAAAANTYGTRGFTYDDAGNRLTKTQNANSTTYTYPSANNKLASLTGYETASFTYDLNGNITGNGTHTFTYTDDNRIRNVDNGTTAVYAYDIQGRRIAKILGGTLAALYHYDLNGRLLAETDGYGRTLTEYIYLNGQLLSKIDALSDTDADGLPDALETAIATNPNAVDSDNDGFTDGYEFNRGSDPKQAASKPTTDDDQDGLSNQEEVRWGADPNLTDSDGDGLTDGNEVNLYHYDPSLSDTDADGIPDGSEDWDGDTLTNLTDPLPFNFNYMDGDINADSIVDMADALLAMRIATNQITPTTLELQHGDVVPTPIPDGIIDIADALIIMRKAMGLIAMNLNAIEQGFAEYAKEHKDQQELVAQLKTEITSHKQEILLILA
ncbi:MAG: hypothetical protein AABY87_01950, partial [bacterium]